MAGRPVSFTKQLQKDAGKYIDEYEKYDHAVPSLVGRCDVINRAKSTIYDWAKRDDNEFSDILAAINEKQELVTFNGALKGTLNPMISKLLLGKHGYHDRQDIDVTDNRQHSTSEEVSDRARELLGKGSKGTFKTPVTH